MTGRLLLIKAGIALGSLVAAIFAYGVTLLLLGPILAWFAGTIPFVAPLVVAIAPVGLINVVVVFVLGGLIYRSIVSRDPRLSGHAAV